MNILVIDDEKNIRITLCNILEDETQPVSIAGGGAIVKELKPYQILSLRFS